ncbi:MAG: hypothetical protein ACREOE_19925, partial [Gemmatimonadales bacterium]
AIVDNYGLALAYRGGEHSHHHHVRARRVAERAAPAPGPLRAVPCHRLIEQPWGQLFLSYVVLSDEVTDLHVTMRPVLAPPGQPRAGAYRGSLAGRGRVAGCGVRAVASWARGCPRSSP